MKKFLDILLCYILPFVLIVGSISVFILLRYFLKFEWSMQGALWMMISAVATCVLAITAIAGFSKAREVARFQTSLQFCADMHKQFQDEEFKQRETRILKGLENQKICPISDLPDEELKHDIKVYCGFMDNIGVLIKQKSVEPDIVIAYYGAGILFNYDLIKPYLDLERLKQFHQFNHSRVPAADVALIKDAYRLEYAHFELLALQIRKRGPEIVKDFEKRLHKLNKI